MAPQHTDSDRTPAPWRTIRRWLPAVLAAGLGGSAFAQTPPTTPPTPPTTPVKVDPPLAEPVKEKEKLYEVKFDKTEWKQVFEWLETQTGLMFLSKDMPTGSCTLKSLPGKKYTLGELFDLFNERLELDNYIILRKQQSFAVWPASDRVDPIHVPTVNAEEVAKRGKTEVVKMVIPLVTLNAEDVLPQVKKSLSKFGEVSQFGTDKLLMIDKADNVRFVLRLVEETIKGKDDQLTHKCDYKRASEVANTLRTLLKDEVAPAAATPGGGQWVNGQWVPTPPAAVATAKRFQAIAITVDDEQNALTITGPVGKVLAAKDLIEKLDKGDKKRPAPGKAMWETYTVASNAAEAMGKQLMGKPEFIGSSVVAMAKGTDQVMVYAYQADHVTIREFLTSPPPAVSSTLTKVLPTLISGESLTAAAATIKTNVGGGVTVDATVDGNPGIVVRGTAEQLKAAEDFARALGILDTVTPGQPTDRVRSITLDKGNASALADRIAEMGRKMGMNPQVVDPNAPPPKPKKDETPMKPPLTPGGPSSAPSPNKISSPNGLRQVKAQLVDPEKKPDVIITVVGNKLVISGDDPKNVEMMYQLMSLYTRGDKATERYEVIRLKNITSEEAAKVINSVFNETNPGQPAQQGARGGGIGAALNPLALLGLGGGSAPADPKAGRVKVVAEKSSNSLIIVKASEIDVLTIKDLLKKAIDSGEEAEGGVSKRWIIPLKHAKASEMVVTIRNVYANYTGGRARGAQAAAQPFNPFLPQQPAAQSSGSSLNVDYDVASNQVIVDCTEALAMDIKELCEKLDKDTKDSEMVTEVIQVTGIAPSQLQSLVEAIQGKAPTTTTLGNTQGGFGGTRGGTGGFGGLGGGTGGFGGFGGTGTGGFGGFGGTGTGFGGTGLGGVGGGRGGVGGFGGTGTGGTRGTGGFGGVGAGGTGGTRGTGGVRGAGRAQRSDMRISATYPDGGGGQRPFEYGGTDAPSARLLFDPEVDLLPGYDYPISDNGPRMSDIPERAFTPPPAPTIRFSKLSTWSEPAPMPAVTQVQATQPPGGVQVPPVPKPTDPKPTDPPATPGTNPPVRVLNFTKPPDNIELYANDGLGTLVIRARTKEDLEAMKRLIEILMPTIAKDIQVAVEIVELKKADASVVVAELQVLYGRLLLGPEALTFPQAARTGAQGGFGGQFGGGGGGFAGQGASAGNIILYAIPRRNAILVAVPQSSMKQVKKQIGDFDTGTAETLQPVRYVLKNASAVVVQQQILNLFLSRFPQDSSDKIRVTADSSNNAVLVQAGPADQEDIAHFIKLLDSDVSEGVEKGAINNVRVFRLKNAFADELAGVINQTLVSNIYTQGLSNTQSGGTGTTGAQGGFGGAQGGFGGAQQTGGGQFGSGAAGGGGVGGAANTLTRTAGVTTKTTALKFDSAKGVFESGLLEDVHITPDVRINALIVTAPEKTMKLVEALVHELDGVAAAKSYVNVFQLKKADATQVQNLIITLFSRQQGAGGVGGLGQGGQGGLGTGTAQGATRPLLTLTGTPSDGASLIDLRLTTDVRTNSLIVAGSQNDLELVRAVIAKLEDSTAPVFATEVVKLRNAAAADVASALNTFLGTNGLIAQANAVIPAGSSINVLQRQVLITPEPITNQLLISATPAMMPDILRLLQAVDAAPPQVHVDVLIAEVSLTNNEEIGAEIGLQSNVLFQRAGSGAAGYNFNSTAALPNTTNVTPGLVGFQGLGNLGVNRVGTSGVGGLVLSASSDSFSLLIRALKSQGRVDVLSRPSLTLTDNQTGFFQVGQDFPIITGTNATLGVAQTTVETRPIGIVLRVTPRIGPDNSVLMRVEPQVSDATQTTVQISPGIFAFAINTQTVETTVLAADGETVVLGGLIRKSDQKSENKVPILGDLPLIGAAFRFRSQAQQKREIVFIMTPKVMRSPGDMRRVFADEARKMSWSIKDVANVTGVCADTIRGNTTDGSLGGGFAPVYAPPPGTTVLPPSSPTQPLYPPTPGWPAGTPGYGSGSTAAIPAAPQQYQPQPQYQPPANVPGVPVSAPPQPQPPPPAVNPAAYQQQPPVMPQQPLPPAAPPVWNK